jgi:hypothetical protein
VVARDAQGTLLREIGSMAAMRSWWSAGLTAVRTLSINGPFWSWPALGLHR